MPERTSKPPSHPRPTGSARDPGRRAVSHFKNEIAMIDGSSDDVIRRYAKQEVRIAAPAVFESKRPDGDRVTIEKPREGVIVVFPDGLVFVRGIGFGAREGCQGTQSGRLLRRTGNDRAGWD